MRTKNKKRKEILKNGLQYLLICACTGLLLFGGNIIMITKAQADECNELPKVEDIKDKSFIPLANPKCWGNITGPSDTSLAGEFILKQLLFGIYENIKYVFSALAVLFLVYNGFRFVTADNDEETIKQQKAHLLWSFIGISLLAGAWEISQIFEYTDRTFLADSTELKKRLHLFDQEIKIILTFGRYVMGSIAVLYLVLSGAKLITSGDDEQTVTKAKKNFAASIAGLIIIMIADYLINQVLYKVNKTGTAISGQGVEPGINIGKGLELLGQMTNFVASFAGPVAIIMLVIAALLYVTSFGEESKMTAAKGIVTGTVIALVVIYGIYAVVATVISGSIG